MLCSAFRLVLLSSTALAAVTGEGGGGHEQRERCEEITIPMCRGIGYNYTIMPNQFHHNTQDEAGLEVHQFTPLIRIQCSEDLRFFLCSLYSPICIEEYQSSLPSCRSVCERARAGCAPVMRRFGFDWPDRMNCENLPSYGDQDRPCIDSKNGAVVVNLDPSVLSSTALAAVTGGGGGGHEQRERCEEITIPFCRGIGYNYTFMPNQFHHDSQNEAGLEVHQFWPLVEIQCSDDLRLFLCSLYTPICIEEYQGSLPPCRSVCERARAGCAPIMRRYGFAWPNRMNCEDLPSYGDQDRACIDFKNSAVVANLDPNVLSSTVLAAATGVGGGGHEK